MGELDHNELEHRISVLKLAKQALIENDSLKLKELSNQTIHCACTIQDAGSITFAVVIYSLSKLMEKKDYMKIKNWNSFEKKMSAHMTLASLALTEKREDAFEAYLESMRKTLSSISLNLKPYIEEIMKKASLNKASRIYEHGISLGRTAKLLGVSPWELSQYASQSNKNVDIQYNRTLDEAKRAKLVLEFFE